MLSREDLSEETVEGAAQALASRIDPRNDLSAARPHVRNYYRMLAAESIVAAGEHLVADVRRALIKETP